MAQSTKSGFTAEERAAMKERAKELKANASKEESAKEVLSKIEAMDDDDRAIAERLHELITSSVTELYPKTYYGMVGYARDGKIVCFFQDAKKFGTRYCTFGFNDTAAIDDGTLWPTAYAVLDLNDANRKLLTERIRLAVS